MNSKQRRALSESTRLNYLVDSGISAEEIKELLPKTSLSFIENIISKRNRPNNILEPSALSTR